MKVRRLTIQYGLYYIISDTPTEKDVKLVILELNPN